MDLAPPAGSQTILLADSDVFARNLLNRGLRGEGYFVLAAANWDEAIALSRSFEGPIHLLLAASRIPGKVALVDQVVRDRPQIRVLIISEPTHAGLSRHSRERGLWSGAGSPLPEELRARIAQALSSPGPPGGTGEV